MRFTPLLAFSPLLLIAAAACNGKPKTGQPAIKPAGEVANPSAPAASAPSAPFESVPSALLNNVDLTSLEEYNRQGLLRTVYFDTDTPELRPVEGAALDANIAWLKAHPQFNVLLEGNCDENNTEEYNLSLGQQRSERVKEYLTTHGIYASRVRTISYGEDHPALPGHTEEAWSKNRRVEFKLLGK